jgi:hypothetical protein
MRHISVLVADKFIQCVKLDALCRTCCKSAWRISIGEVGSAPYFSLKHRTASTSEMSAWDPFYNDDHTEVTRASSKTVHES